MSRNEATYPRSVMLLKLYPDLSTCDQGDRKLLQIYKIVEGIWNSGPLKDLGPWEKPQILESQS